MTQSRTVFASVAWQSTVNKNGLPRRSDSQ